VKNTASGCQALARKRRATPGPARLALIVCLRVHLLDVVGCELPQDNRMHDLLLGCAVGDVRWSIGIEVAHQDQEQPEVTYLGQQPVQSGLISDRA
jgi:hypothetical protein